MVNTMQSVLMSLAPRTAHCMVNTMHSVLMLLAPKTALR